MASLDELIEDREALQRLVDEHQMFKETIEHSPAQFCVYDKDDQLIAWNQAYEDTHAKAFARHRAEGNRHTQQHVRISQYLAGFQFR